VADTEYAALLAASSTNVMQPTDQLVLVRGGVPRPFNGTLPAISAAGAYSILGGGDIFEVGAGARRLRHSADSGGVFVATGAGQTGSGFYYDEANKQVRCYTDSAERWRVDASGNLLVGASSPAFSSHTINKAVAATTAILTVQSTGTGYNSAIFLAADGHGYSTSGAAMWVGKYTGSGRGMNVGGTVNASGSDYAEYIRKALAWLEIAFLKGQVLGIDHDGNLTGSWSVAHSFVIKSYDPSIVGGDTWSKHLLRPAEPVRPANDGTEDAIADAKAAHAAAMAQYDIDLAAFEAALEEARRTVDRIAFSGQVPVIVHGAYAPGQYLVAFEGEGDTIECRALDWADIVADPARLLETRIVGKVWAVRQVQLDPADTSDAPEMVTRAWANVLHR